MFLELSGFSPSWRSAAFPKNVPGPFAAPPSAAELANRKNVLGPIRGSITCWLRDDANRKNVPRPIWGYTPGAPVESWQPEKYS